MAPLNVTHQYVPEGKPDSVNVTELVVGIGVKVAVMVPVPSIDAVVVDAELELNVIEAVLEDQ